MVKRQYEQPTVFLELLREFVDLYDDGFLLDMPDVSPPTFSDELVARYYPSAVD